MNKILKIDVQFKKLGQTVQKKGQNPVKKRTGLIDFGLPYTLVINSYASNSIF